MPRYISEFTEMLLENYQNIPLDVLQRELGEISRSMGKLFCPFCGKETGDD
jgi:hypothetical protein